jgi:DNA polymerase III delta subunit
MAREPHPAEELQRLQAGLAKGLAKGYVLRGEESWYRQKAFELLLASARDRAYEVCRHDASDSHFDLQALHGDLLGRSLFAEARFIAIHQPAEIFKKQGRADSPAAASVLSFLAGPRPGVVVIDGDGLRADHPVCKSVQSSGGLLLSFRKLWDQELVRWIADRAREMRLRLGERDAIALAAVTGNDLHLLEGELEKLRLAPGAGSPASIQPAGSQAADTQFQLVDALLSGDWKAAVTGLEVFFRGGFKRQGRREVDPAALFAVLLGTLRGSLRRYVEVARSLAQGGSLEAAATAAGVPTWPKARQAFRQNFAARPSGQWERMFEDLAAFERRTREWGQVDQNDLAWLALRWRAGSTKT